MLCELYVQILCEPDVQIVKTLRFGVDNEDTDLWMAQWCTPMTDETARVTADDDGGEWDGIMVETGRGVAM